MNSGGFRFNGSSPLDQNTYIARLDLNLANEQLFVRGNYQWDHEGTTPRFPDTPVSGLWQHPVGLAVGHTWSLTPNFINTIRYGLTREAFSNLGDSSDASIFFRPIFLPRHFARSVHRTTPTHNLVNDTSWIKVNHSFQFGTNIRWIENRRISFFNSHDSATVFQGGYSGFGGALEVPGLVLGDDQNLWRNAIASVLGRYTDLTSRFIFDNTGTLQPAGTPSSRNFATEEYEFYLADTWQVVPSLTVNLGIRGGVNTPVREQSGFQVTPTRPLAEFFELRKAGAATGNPFNELITIDTAGPFYGKPGFYPTDKNNWSPRISAAWSPSLAGGLGRIIFGDSGQSVIRGGYSISYDRIGSALAVQFDGFNRLGFSSSVIGPDQSVDTSSNPGPLFTGFGQDIRPLLELAVRQSAIPTSLQFPLSYPADGARRIQNTLDSALTTPIHHSFSLSYGRELSGGLFIEGSYLRRRANELLGDRDIMHLNNLRDPASGMTWYEAARVLADARLNDVPVESIAPIPYFEKRPGRRGKDSKSCPSRPTRTNSLRLHRPGT